MKTARSDRLMLLDVNVLVALAWPAHQFHALAVARLERKPVRPWATCLVTQLAFVRLTSNPLVVGVRKSPREAAEVLAALTSDQHHVYLADDRPPALDPEMFDRLIGHQQVTDAWLVAFTQRHGATLLTLDGRLSALAAEAWMVEVLEP
jgi:toxin-antitoxin system PIN domain toxin